MSSNTFCCVFIKAVILYLIFANVGHAATLIVPDTYVTIQSAIDAAVLDDVVMVRDGTYTGSGNKNLLIDKAITLRSENGSSNCIIDCENFGRGMEIRDAVTVSGFTIRNGNQPGDFGIGVGGGIYCFAPFEVISISDCIIQNNEAEKDGGGMYITYSDVTIEDSIIEDNHNGWSGGGIYATTSSIQISRCIIRKNRAGRETGGDGGGILIRDQRANTAIINSLIYQNLTSKHGGGIHNWPDDAENPVEIINCTIVDNEAEGVVSPNIAAGGIFSVFYPMKVSNSIVYGNSLRQFYHYESDNSDVTYSDVEGGFIGVGNIDALPHFENAEVGDYRLLESSPCIDTADSVAAPSEDIEGIGRPLGNGWDMGSYESAYTNLPPDIDSTFPVNGAINIASYVTLSVNFTDPMDESSIDSSSFSLTSNGNPVSGTVGYDGYKATFKPTVDMQGGSTYTAMVTSGVRDNAGNNMPTDFQWTFTTADNSSSDDDGGDGDGGGGCFVESLRD